MLLVRRDCVIEHRWLFKYCISNTHAVIARAINRAMPQSEYAINSKQLIFYLTV